MELWRNDFAGRSYAWIKPLSEINQENGVSEKMKKWLCILPLFIGSACTQQEIKAEALKDVPAYSNTDLAYNSPDFIVRQHSICFLGGEIYGKADRFVEIRCESGFVGFVIEDEAFKKIGNK